MNLWLDDIRDPKLYSDVQFVWVKTIKQAQDILKIGEVVICELDHDLGESYGDSLDQPSTSPTGYDLLVWMSWTGNWPKEKPVIHSDNNIGADRMRRYINKNFGRNLSKEFGETQLDEFGRVDFKAFYQQTPSGANTSSSSCEQCCIIEERK